MIRTIIIRDYAGVKQKVEVKNFEEVLFVQCDIKSGDEILTVTYEDLKTEIFDSSDCRIIDYDDGSEFIYIKDKLDLIDIFSEKETSYSDFINDIEE